MKGEINSEKVKNYSQNTCVCDEKHMCLFQKYEATIYWNSVEPFKSVKSRMAAASAGASPDVGAHMSALALSC